MERTLGAVGAGDVGRKPRGTRLQEEAQSPTYTPVRPDEAKIVLPSKAATGLSDIHTPMRLANDIWKRWNAIFGVEAENTDLGVEVCVGQHLVRGLGAMDPGVEEAQIEKARLAPTPTASRLTDSRTSRDGSHDGGDRHGGHGQGGGHGHGRRHHRHERDRGNKVSCSAPIFTRNRQILIAL